jgi:hypothetical protein
MTRKRWIVVAPAVALLLTSTVAATRKEKLPCEVAAAWASENVASLPRTHAELGKYSPLYRKAIYRKLTSGEKTQLWQDHFQQYLSPTYNFTTQQRQVISYVMSRAAQYLDGNDGRRLIKTDTMERRVRELFTPEQVHEIFYTLGPAPAAQETVASNTSSTNVLGYCNCEQNTSSSCLFGTCRAGTGCQIEETGCGFMGCGACDGMCYAS